MRLGRQEGTPRRPSSTGCRIDAGAVEDSTGRGADLVAEAGELAVDPSVSPQLGFSLANRSEGTQAGGDGWSARAGVSGHGIHVEAAAERLYRSGSGPM